MGARKPVKANHRYGARELRRTVEGHSPLDEILSEDGSGRNIINKHQPAPTPKTLRNKTYDIDEAVPIELSFSDNIFSPPPFGSQMELEIASRKRRLYEEVMTLGLADSAGQAWMAAHAPQIETKQSWPFNIDGPSYLTACKKSLFLRIPKLYKNRSNLVKSEVKEYLIDQICIIIMLECHLVYFNIVYSHFASIANENFKGGSETGKEVSLGRIVEAFERLPSSLTDTELLDVSFYGLLDASLIHMDHHVMSDILGLAAALGHLRYGTFRPTEMQARAFLYAVEVAPDASPYRQRLGVHRQNLAERLVKRFVPADLREDLTEVCCAVACRRLIPEGLHKLQPEVIL